MASLLLLCLLPCVLLQIVLMLLQRVYVLLMARMRLAQQASWV
jgi:hypothetical protein